MTSGESYQANDFSRDPYFHSISQQAHNHALQNAWVSLRHWDILCFANAHSSVCIPLQVSPAPADGLPEDHQEDIPPPVGSVAGPGGVQDPPYIDAAYQGMADYHPQPLGVSNSRLSAAGPLLIKYTLQ